MTRMRSVSGMAALRMFRIVVFPVPVPPAMRMLRRSWTARIRSSALSDVMELRETRSASVYFRAANFRIVKVMPRRETGSRTAATRLPSSRRVEDGLGVGDVVVQVTGERLRRHQEVGLKEPGVERRDLAISLDEDRSVAVDHDLADGVLEEDVLDGPQEREDELPGAAVGRGRDSKRVGHDV
jgi:hypothetical protein